MERVGGDITTLLDLTPRDRQDNDLFPLNTDQTWFTRDPDRRIIPSVPLIADFPFRGPATFGQRFTFDIGSVPCGDLLLGCAVQIRLPHWLDATTQLHVSSGQYVYTDPATAWFYANSLGSAIIEKAELEIDGKTVEEIDGDFINVCASLFTDLNEQFGVAIDHLGRCSIPKLLEWNPNRMFPTEDGVLHCVLPFFFMRTRVREALPMIAIKEGAARIHITLRPFTQCVRQRGGARTACDSVPLDTAITFRDTTFAYDQFFTVKTVATIPDLTSVRLVTFGSILDGKMRDAMLRQSFEIIHREVQTFYFSEPLKYTVSKNSGADTVRISLPLEANHPLEEILWFVRRKDVAGNNEWTNYGNVLEKDYEAVYNRPEPLLVNAVIQVNGVTICDAEEGYYRELIARHHRGGIIPYEKFIYGYPFARHPGDHQPSGTLNASRVQSLRLVLEVKGGAEWEVKVFCLGINWLRFQNGLAGSVFED
jgi:Large eukaryotic DNA virus major capsid protein/Major capsid protein N-terminus